MGKLTIDYGDIVSDRFLSWCDAVVNSTNPLMMPGSGVCGAIYHKAGREQLEQYVKETYGLSFATPENAMRPPEVRITPGFRLPCDILFAQGPKAWDYPTFGEAFSLLKDTYKNILKTAAERGYKRILMPAMGTGHYGFTHEETAAEVVVLLKEMLSDSASAVDVLFVLGDEQTANFYRQFL